MSNSSKATIEVISSTKGYSLVMNGQIIAGPKPQTGAILIHVFKVDVAEIGSLAAQAALEAEKH
jgi:hypothetical protein